MKNKKIVSLAILFLIIALGIFLRTYHIETAPPGIYPDEAVNGEDAIRANETGEYKWFYPANQGREGLFMNLIALSFKLFGISILTLKLPAILFGVLSIFGMYLLGKELFKSDRIGLISAFLYAVSFWAINFNRISFRANMLPFVLIFTFYFLFRGIRTKKFGNFALSGFVFGIGMHTYIAFRIAPLILIALLFSFIIFKNKFLKEYWKHIAVFLLLMFLSASPMLYTFYSHPEFLESRSASISILSPEVNQGHLFETFFKSFGLSLAKFNFYGDQNWRHNYPPYPVLDPLVGIAFLFGIIYATAKLVRLLVERVVYREKDEAFNTYFLLIAWFFAMLVPEFMTAEGLPHALRSIGSLPAVIFFSAIGFDYFIRKSEAGSRFYRKIVFSLIMVMLIFVGLFNAVKYHYFWANKAKVGLSFNKNLTDMSKYIQTLPQENEKFVVTSYNTLEKLPIYIFNTKNNVSFSYPNESDRINPESDDFMILLTENNHDIIISLQQKFPKLVLHKIENSLGSEYYILK